MNINVPDNKKIILLLQITISCIVSLPSFVFYKSKKSMNHPANLTFEQTTNDYSLLIYCKTEDNLKSIFNYYQLLLFSLFMTSLIIITICYLRVYKHVYKASQNQRRESMPAINHLNVQNSATANVKNICDSFENFSSNDSSIHLRKRFKKSPKRDKNNFDKIHSMTELNLASRVLSKGQVRINKKLHIPKIQIVNDLKVNLRKNSSRHMLNKKELSKIEESTTNVKNVRF